MKSKNTAGIITVALQSIFIVLMLVNIGYCLCTLQMKMFFTTIYNSVFGSFANYFKTGNQYDLVVFLILLIFLIALTTITAYALLKDESTMTEWIFVLNGVVYLSDLFIETDMIMLMPKFFFFNFIIIFLMLLLVIWSGTAKVFGRRVYVNTKLIPDSYYQSDKDFKNHGYECNRVLKNVKIALVFQAGFFYISLYTKYYDIVGLLWVVILYAIGLIIAVSYFVTSFSDYRKLLSKYDFFDERTEKVEIISKYVKCEGMSLIAYLLSGLFVFLF